MNDVFIWIRATLDWDDPRSRELVDPGFGPKVELWDETFTVP